MLDTNILYKGVRNAELNKYCIFTHSETFCLFCLRLLAVLLNIWLLLALQKRIQMIICALLQEQHLKYR